MVFKQFSNFVVGCSIFSAVILSSSAVFAEGNLKEKFQEKRQAFQEKRQEKRDERKEMRQQKKEERQANRQERREERQDKRAERKQTRQENRGERRAQRQDHREQRHLERKGNRTERREMQQGKHKKSQQHSRTDKGKGQGYRASKKQSAIYPSNQKMRKQSVKKPSMSSERQKKNMIKIGSYSRGQDKMPRSDFSMKYNTKKKTASTRKSYGSKGHSMQRTSSRMGKVSGQQKMMRRNK